MAHNDHMPNKTLKIKINMRAVCHVTMSMEPEQLAEVVVSALIFFYFIFFTKTRKRRNKRTWRKDWLGKRRRQGLSVLQREREISCE